MTPTQFFIYSGNVCLIHENSVLSSLACWYFDKDSKISINRTRKPSILKKLCEFQHERCERNSSTFIKIKTNQALDNFGLKHHANTGQSLGKILFKYGVKKQK